MTFSSNRDWPVCACGCGEPVPVRKASNPSKGWKIGDPCKFVAGHSNRVRIRRPVNGLFRCPKCGEKKLKQEFHADSRRPFGIYVYCKTCQASEARERYARDREAIIDRTSTYNRLHPEVTSKALQRYRATPRGAEKARQHASDYRARKTAQFVESIDPAVVWTRSKGRCGKCGGQLNRDDFHVDHRIPLARGGKHSYENVQAAHPRCNAIKRDRLTSEVDIDGRKQDMASRTRF